MGLDKDFKDGALSDDALENVTGGMEDVVHLPYTGKEKKKIGNTRQDGKPGFAGNLLHKEQPKTKKTTGGSFYSGEFKGKGTYC